MTFAEKATWSESECVELGICPECGNDDELFLDPVSSVPGDVDVACQICGYTASCDELGITGAALWEDWGA